MTAKVMQVADLINTMDQKELNEVVECVKLRRQFFLRKAIRSVVVGDRVWFDSGRRGRIRGVVTKINRKTIGVRADSGVDWRVHASLINPEFDPESVK